MHVQITTINGLRFTGEIVADDGHQLVLRDDHAEFPKRLNHDAIADVAVDR